MNFAYKWQFLHCSSYFTRFLPPGSPHAHSLDLLSPHRRVGHISAQSTPSRPIQAAPHGGFRTNISSYPHSVGSPPPGVHQGDRYALHSLLSSRPDPPRDIPQLQAPSPLCVVTCPSLPGNQASDTQSALAPPYPSLTKLGVALSKPLL